MNDLISRKYLYEKMVEKEELARQRVLDTPTHSPAYLRYVAQLNERTALKHEIADAPPVESEPQWIPCNERLPEKSGNYLVCSKDVIWVANYFNNAWWGVEKRYRWGDIEAWMPLPQPYKGE